MLFILGAIKKAACMRENIKYRLSMKPINFKSKQKPAKFTVPGLDEVRRYAGFIKFSKHYFRLKLKKGLTRF